MFLKDLKKTFIEESYFMLEEFEESLLILSNDKNNFAELNKIFRVFHTIKGSSAAVELNTLSEFTHLVEDCLVILIENTALLNDDFIYILMQSVDYLKNYLNLLVNGEEDSWNCAELKEKIINFKEKSKKKVQNLSNEGVKNKIKSADTEITNINKLVKVESVRLDSVFDLIGELSVIRSQILENFMPMTQNNLQQNSLLNLFDKISKELQEKTLSMRLTSIKPIFIKMNRIIQDLSLKLNKQVEVEFIGEEIELDRYLIEQISDPLLHMVRNSMDHGIEYEDERVKLNKNKVAKIILSARKINGKIVIKIKDDGRGISLKKVIKKAKEKKLIEENFDEENIDKNKIYQLIFKPGFSTAEVVTEVSGRGIGLDVVKNNISKVNGSIEIDSVENEGTEFKIILPVTTTIANGILAEYNMQKIIIPLDNVSNIIDDKHIRKESRYIYINDKAFPLFKLSDLLKNNLICKSGNSKQDKRKVILLLSTIEHKFCLVIDRIIDHNQVVIKPLGNVFKNCLGISGFSILGDGKIATVLDVEGLYKIVESKINSGENHNLKEINFNE